MSDIDMAVASVDATMIAALASRKRSKQADSSLSTTLASLAVGFLKP
jgi:hypothetical protein